MYFSGKIEIDPSQMTLIKRVKPSKLFGKLLDTLTFGQLSKKQEQETFTALTILQQLNMGLRSMSIENVIRLAVDDYDFYLDEKGEDDDLSQAMFELKAKIDPLESEIFKTIYLVLEHLDNHLKYLIEISVERKHQVGEYPIGIKVNAVISDFKLRENETNEMLDNRIKFLFANQEKYDQFIIENRNKFDHFLNEMELAIRKVIKVDDIKLTSATQIIRPKKRIASPENIKHEHHSQPLFFGYYGLDSYFYYSWMWSSMMYSHNIYTHDVNIVDELGNEVMSVGEEGFNAGESNTLNIDSDFEPPVTGDIQYFGDNEYSDNLDKNNLLADTSNVGQDSDSSSWLDDAGGGDDSASCSSCSSSCGGCSSD